MRLSRRPVPALRPTRLPFHYGWVIVFTAFLVMMNYGVFYSYGVFFKPMAEEFGWSRGTTSLAFTVNMMLYSVMAIPMGWLTDRQGPRIPVILAGIFIGGGLALSSLVSSAWQLVLFFGVIAAVGHGATFVAPVSTVLRWFNHRRGLAIGLVTSGNGVGTLFMPSLINALVAGHGWRAAYIWVGVIVFAINVLAAFVFRSHPRDLGLAPYGAEPDPSPAREGDPLSLASEQSSFTLAQALKTRAFWLVFFIIALIFAAYLALVVHVVPYATDVGVSPAVAAGALGAMGVGAILGRIGSGALCDRIGGKKTMLLGAALHTAVVFGVLGARAGWSFYVLMPLLGMASSGTFVVMTPILGEYFGIAHVGRLLGVAFTCGVISGIVGPSLAGYLYDAQATYFWAFLVAGVMSGLSALLCLLLAPPRPPAEPGLAQS